MRKLLDTKAGATFHQELPHTTLCIRKDSVELIYKLKPAVYMIIHVLRISSNQVILHAEWGNYFDRLTNPDAQLAQIKRTCPVLYDVLSGQDEDGVNLAYCKSGCKGLSMVCEVDSKLPIYCCLTDELMKSYQVMVRKNIAIYNELLNCPPFPAWKKDLCDLWN